MAPGKSPRSQPDMHVPKDPSPPCPRSTSLRSTNSIRDRLFSGVLGSWRKRSSGKVMTDSPQDSEPRPSLEDAAMRSPTPQSLPMRESSLGLVHPALRDYSQLSHDSYPSPTFDYQTSNSQDSRHIRASFSILADAQAVPALESRDLWVALTIAPMLPPNTPDSDGDKFPLDVVVVVDSTSFEGKRMLEGLEETLQEISKYLDHAHDRLAVLNTHAPNESTGKPRKAPHYSSFLSTPKPSTIRNAMSRIKSQSSRRASVDAGTLLTSAIEAALRLVRSRRSDRREVEASFYHIIVISSSPQLASDGTATDEPVHLLNPAILRRPHVTTKLVSGWALSSSCLLSATYSLKNDLHTLSSFFRSARQGCGLARLENVNLDVKASTGYPIRGSLGMSKCGILVPGETAVTMLKVHVPKWGDAELMRGLTPSEKEMHKLEAYLDVAISSVFAVRLSYQQRGPSLLKHCTRNFVFHLNRPNPSSDWSMASPQHPKPFYPLRPHEHTNRTQKLIAAAVAGLLPRQNALALVRAMLYDWECDEEVRLKLYALAEELELPPPGGAPLRDEDITVIPQTRWILRSCQRLQEPTLALVHDELSVSRSGSADSSGTILHRERTLPVTPPREDTTITNENVKLDEMQPVAREERRGSTSSDKAQGIWRSLRQGQRIRTATDEMEQDEAERRESADDIVHELRRVALRNQRSVGTDTLRSLSEGSPPARPVGPWL